MRWLAVLVLLALTGCGQARAASPYRVYLPRVIGSPWPDGYVFPQPEPMMSLSTPVVVPYTQATVRVVVTVGTTAKPIVGLPITVVYTRPKAGAYVTTLYEVWTDDHGQTVANLPVAGDIDPSGAPEGKNLHVLARYDKPADTTHWFFSQNRVIAPY